MSVIEAFGNIGDAKPVDFLIHYLDTDNEILLQATLVSLVKIDQKSPTGAFDLVKAKGIDVLFNVRSALTIPNPDIRVQLLIAYSLNPGP